MPAVSTCIAGLVDLFRSPLKSGTNNSIPTNFSVASLLIRGFLPGEKRQRGRWRPGWWYEEWLGRGFLFLIAKMSQYPVNDVLVLDARDHFDRASTASTDLDVDIEHALESLSPGLTR